MPGTTVFEAAIRPFAAAHEGTCVECSSSFSIGDLITQAAGGWSHAHHETGATS